jgi:hypothetical protein
MKRAKVFLLLNPSVGPKLGAAGPDRLDQKACLMKSRFDAVLRALCALIPGACAALGVTSTALAAHDDGVVRTIGAGSTGIWRALDLLVAAPMMLLPLGTRACRAGLAGAFVTAVAGWIGFEVAQALTASTVTSFLKNVSGKKAERLVSAVSAVAVLTALLSPAWQTEAASPGGATTGALLVMLALRFTSLPALALIAGAAASYEPLAFLAVLASATPTFAQTWADSRRASTRLPWAHAGCMFLLGLGPLAVGVAVGRRAPEISLLVPAVERTAHVGPIGFALGEIGFVLGIAGVAGAALASIRPASRPVLGAVAAGIAALALHAPSGPNRYAAADLAGLVAFYILMANALAVLVLVIARARVPFAEASAAMVVLIELVLPVRSADEAFARREARAAHAAAIWNDIAWGSAAPAAILLVHDRGTMGRIASARAAGEFREDLVVVPAYQVQSRAGERALLAEPKLAPLYRDMALDVPPEELSLSQLGAQRPVLSNFDPKWDRALSRHLVPLGLTAKFEPEPRGTSERVRALDAFHAEKDRLVRITVAKKDAELAAATATLLRARAIGMGATGERDVLSKALDDLRAFAPDDLVGSALVRRLVTTKGAIDVKDLKPYP